MSLLRFYCSLGCCLALPLCAYAEDSAPRPDAVASASWPQWRGPARDGKSPDTNLATNWESHPPKLLWTAEGLGAGYASVSVAEGVIYTTGNLENGQGVTAINAADGSIRWTKPITSELPDHKYEGARCTPSIDGDRLYVIASSGKIVCLKRADGNEIWSRDFSEWGGKMMSGWGFSESPLVDGDWVLCTPGGPKAMLVALDKLTGQEVWKATVPGGGEVGKEGAGYSSIVVSNACGVKQYVQLIGRGLIGIRASDGKFLWNYNQIANRTANIPTPIVTGDFVFASTGYQTGAVLLKLVKAGDGIEAEEQYFKEGDEFQNHHGGMILKDGYIYAGHKHNSGFPICMELETGKIAWGGEERGPGGGSAAVTYADGHLIFRYQKGEVALIEADPSEYRLKGVFVPEHVTKSPAWSHPVVIGGKLYLREQDKLMCYDMR